MHLHNETAAPMGSIIGSGGWVVTKAVAAKDYQNPTTTATEIAVSIIARRYGLSIARARLVCHLAGIGGRCA